MSKPELLAQDADSKYPPSSVAGSVRGRQGDVALLTYDELDEKRATSFVADDGAGATVLFSGTTRNSFQGKTVSKLEYEAYSSLALRTLRDLLDQAHTSAPFADTPVARSANAAPESTQGANEDRISKCYIAHRLGEVRVGECSILIAVSSAHRKEAFVVAEWLLEEVKKNVAVWKCEFYESGETLTALDGQGAPINPSMPQRAETGDDQSWSWKANFPASSKQLPPDQ